MKEGAKYNLTQEVLDRAGIKGNPQDMKEWMDSLDEHELDDWLLIATRKIGTNSGIEMTEAMFKAIVLLAFELDTMELAIDEEKAKDVTKRFLLNILLWKGQRDGLYHLKGKLSLITPPELEFTELGKEVARKLIENGDPLDAPDKG